MVRSRTAFDAVAQEYDARRPRYPEALVADLVAAAGITAGSRILEIAPGTGQLTVPLARTGAAVVAVELGRSLAAVARRNLQAYPWTTVDTAAFEDWPLPHEPFDLVVCATAWHWLDQDVRLSRCAAALRPGGSLAVVDTHHIAGGTVGFTRASQACYQRWDPGYSPGFTPPAVADLPVARADLTEPDLFADLRSRRYGVEVTYTAQQFCALLETYSNIRGLEESHRDGLLRCIAELIDGAFAGVVVKPYLFETRLLTRLAR